MKNTSFEQLISFIQKHFWGCFFLYLLLFIFCPFFAYLIYSALSKNITPLLSCDAFLSYTTSLISIPITISTFIFAVTEHQDKIKARNEQHRLKSENDILKRRSEVRPELTIQLSYQEQEQSYKATITNTSPNPAYNVVFDLETVAKIIHGKRQKTFTATGYSFSDNDLYPHELDLFFEDKDKNCIECSYVRTHNGYYVLSEALYTCSSDKHTDSYEEEEK